MSTTQINENTRFRAADAAEHLKQRILPLVMGQQRPAFGCSRDANHTGYAEAEDVVYPDVDADGSPKIGLWRQWSVVMRERGQAAPSHSLSVADFLPKTQLFAMFREAFAGIDVPVELPVVQILSGKNALTTEFSHKRGFTGARRVVVVRTGETCLLRPESTDASLWADATINVSTSGNDDEPLVSVTIDREFIHVTTSAASNSRRYLGGKSGADNLLTFVAAEGANEKDARVPLARLIAFDHATGEHSFELAEGVMSEFAQAVQE